MARTVGAPISHESKAHDSDGQLQNALAYGRSRGAGTNRRGAELRRHRSLGAALPAATTW